MFNTCYKWGMVNMLRRSKNFKGYLLTEGLLALLSMTIALTILIPHLIQLKKQATLLEEQVICTRLLYEETQNKVEKNIVMFPKSRDGIPYEVFFSEKGIRIKKGGVEIGFQEN